MILLDDALEKLATHLEATDVNNNFEQSAAFRQSPLVSGLFSSGDKYSSNLVPSTAFNPSTADDLLRYQPPRPEGRPLLKKPTKNKYKNPDCYPLVLRPLINLLNAGVTTTTPAPSCPSCNCPSCQDSSSSCLIATAASFPSETVTSE